MNLKSIASFLLLAYIFFASACTKQQGFGGLASIHGKVYAYDYTPNGKLEAEGYTGDQRVFISVSGREGVLDDVRTDYQGAYRFDELRPGKYTLWVYTECDTCTDNIKPVIQEVEINSKKQVISMPDFEINI